MGNDKKYRDSCNDLVDNGQSERAFDVEDKNVVVVCKKSPTTNKLHTIAVLDRETQEPIGINHEYYNELKKSQKKVLE